MKKIIHIILAVLFAAGLTAVASDRRTSQTDADRRKADYIFMEAAAARADMKDRSTDYYMLLRRAAALNPQDPYIAGSLAELDVLLPTVDSAATMEAYRTIGRRFFLKPEVEHYGIYYSTLAMRMRRYDDAIAVWKLLDSIQPNRTDPAMNLAKVLVIKGTASGDSVPVRQAVRIYDRLQSTQPGNTELVTHKIQALYAIGDTAGIVRELERLSREAPSEVPALLYVSKCYTVLNMPDSAAVYMDRASAVAPDDGSVRLLRANYYSYQGDTVAYRREVLRALESSELEYEEKFGILRQFVVSVIEDSTSHAEVEKMFNVVQEVNPGEATLHQLFGDYYIETENYAGAAEQYGYSVELDPNQSDVWNGLLRSYSMLNDSSRLLDASKAALHRYPTNIYAALLGASALGSYGREAEALAMLDSIEIVPSHNPKALSQVFLFKGDLLFKLEQVDSAIVAYDRSISYDAENYMALNNAAYFMAVKGIDLPRAEVYASIANAGVPDNATFLDTYAWVCFKKQDYARALELIDKAIAAESSGDGDAGGEDTAETDGADGENEELSSEILDHAGDIYYMNGRPAEAVEFWRRALVLDPDNGLLEKKVKNEAYYFE